MGVFIWFLVREGVGFEGVREYGVVFTCREVFRLVWLVDCG